MFIKKKKSRMLRLEKNIFHFSFNELMICCLDLDSSVLSVLLNCKTCVLIVNAIAFCSCNSFSIFLGHGCVFIYYTYNLNIFSGWGRTNLSAYHLQFKLFFWMGLNRFVQHCKFLLIFTVQHCIIYCPVLYIF
jgi:hypothetical protein